MFPRIKNILTLLKLSLFLLAICLSIWNIRDRFYTNKTSVATATVEMSKRAFPVSISLVITPGFNETALEEAGYQDTYNYFTGRSKYKNNNVGWAGHTADGGVMDEVSGRICSLGIRHK
jgi:formylmethanofuran dehydrogenase subunit B